MSVLVYFSIAVLNFIIAVLFWHVDQYTFRWANIDPMVLLWVHLGGAFFLPISAIITHILFPKLDGGKALFASCWLLVVLFFLSLDIFSGFKHKYVLDISNYVKAFVFYVLPTRMSTF